MSRTPEPVSSARAHDRPLLLAALFVWLAFVLYCVGLAVSNGLCSADDSWFAIIAKSVAGGSGYATTFAKDVEVTRPLLFNPATGTGPALILPCALALKLFGRSELLPGFTAIALWAAVLTAVFARMSGIVNGASMLAGVAVFCGAILATFPFHFEQWYAFLGEILAASLLLAAHWLVALEKLSSRTAFVAGLCVGLALQTKYQALVATGGVFIIFAVQARRARLSAGATIACIALLLAGCVLPTALFELYKLICLGPSAYERNWHEFLAATREMGLQSGTPLSGQLLRDRLILAHARFGINGWALAAFTAVASYFYRRAALGAWSLLFSGVVLSIVLSAGYWVAFSIGWPRYLTISITLICFVFALPLFSLRSWRQKLACAALACLVLASGFPHIPSGARNADHGLFRPNSTRAARIQLVAEIQRFQAEHPEPLASRWWGSFADIEFMLPGSMNFKRIETVLGLPGPKRILINTQFTDIGDPVVAMIRARAHVTLFAEGPYQLLEIE